MALPPPLPETEMRDSADLMIAVATLIWYAMPSTCTAMMFAVARPMPPVMQRAMMLP